MTADNPSYQRPALMVTTLGSFIIPFMGSSINIALPSIGREFSLDALMLNWVTTSYLLSIAVFLLPFGRISDIYGIKKVFLLGFILFTLFSFFSALSPSPSFLIGSRVFQGIGASMTASTGIAILTSVFPPNKKGSVLGINVAAVYTGLSCGPFFGGLLTQHYGWRSIFWVNLPVGFMIILYTLFRLKGEWAEARGERFDWMGSLFYSSALVVMMFGFFRISSSMGLILLAIGLIGIGIFIRWELRVKSPIFEMRLLTENRVFAFSNLAALINYSATFALNFLLSLYLQSVRGLKPQEAGLILITAPVIQALFSPFAGRISDRIEPRKVASTGMAITTLGLFLFIFLDEKTDLFTIVGYLLLLGFGFALFSSPNTNAVMSSVEKRSYGVASGTLSTMRSVGMMFSMGLVMLIFSIFMGRTPIAPPYFPLFLKSVKGAFILFTVLCALGIGASLSRGPSPILSHP